MQIAEEQYFAVFISNFQSPISNSKLVVGVGIEPTFAAFQTAANPSQLSNRNLASVAGLEPATSRFVDGRSCFQLSYTEGIGKKQKANIKS